MQPAAECLWGSAIALDYRMIDREDIVLLVRGLAWMVTALLAGATVGATVGLAVLMFRIVGG